MPRRGHHRDDYLFYKYDFHRVQDANQQRLRKAIDDAQDAEESDDSEGVESTAAVGRLIYDGMKEVNYLDAIMHNKYVCNREKLRAWQSASHIERAPQRENMPVPAKPPTP